MKSLKKFAKWYLKQYSRSNSMTPTGIIPLQNES